MKEHLKLDLSDMESAAKVSKALASPVRLQILNEIKFMPLNISELAERIGIPLSSTSLHIKILEEAGLIITQSLPGVRGAQRICGLKVEELSFTLLNQDDILKSDSVIIENMPIGNYFDCNICPPCGIVSESGFLSPEDNSYGFYSSEKHTAQLLWLTKGYLEYRFPSFLLQTPKEIKSLEFSFEICSEAPGYNNNWKSDITFWINQQEVGYFTSAGDFGGRRGKLNPNWWNNNMTQFGILKTLIINQHGTYIDDEYLSDFKISQLDFHSNDYISFRLGVKEDAKYVGGLNLFGEKFGDYAQNIQMKIIF